MIDTITKYLTKYWWITLIVLSIPAVWALFVPGYYGASDDLHIGWLAELDKIVRAGQLPPRFVPDLSFGYGYPLFNFVFPLPFYIGELFHMLSFSLVDSVKAVFVLSFIGGAFAMYYLLRSMTNQMTSVVGAVLYTYTPYRSTDVYVRGAFGEALAFIFLPLIPLSIIKLTESNTSANKNHTGHWIAIGALAIAGLILSHNITTYMFLPFAVVFALIRLGSLRSLGALLKLVLMAGLGLLISSYFWVPALVESKLMQYDTVFAYFDHFPALKQFITPYWGYGASVPGPYDGMSFFWGIAPLFMLVLALLVIGFHWRRLATIHRQIAIWALVSLISAIGMMNYRSAFLWDHIPLLPYFQFPWRFLIIPTLVIPMLIVLLPYLTKKAIVFYLVGLLAIITTIGVFKPHDFLGRTDNYYLQRYIPYPSVSAEYRTLKEEYLRLPKTTKERPSDLAPRVIAEPNKIISIELKNDLDAQIRTASEQPFVLRYNKYFFPGWYGTIDGQTITLQPVEPYGQIGLEVPAGNHLIKIFFRETPLKLFLDYSSLVAFVITLVLLVKSTTFAIHSRRF